MNAQVQEMVGTLKEQFDGVERVSFEAANKLLDILDEAPREALEILVKERVKFCWRPAMLRLGLHYGMTMHEIKSLF